MDLKEVTKGNFVHIAAIDWVRAYGFLVVVAQIKCLIRIGGIHAAVYVRRWNRALCPLVIKLPVDTECLKL